MAPVIASRLPGLRDLVEPGRTGWLVAEDDPAELAAALERAFDPGLQIERLRRRCTRSSRRYAWRETAEQHIQLYEELHGRRSARAA